MTNDTRSPKRWLIGEPLSSEKMDHQLLPKHLALPIFASDPLSSVAYAPQELLMILLLGGTAFLTLAPGVAAAVVILLIVVVLSYRQLIKAYPSGGGDYEVARTNLGEKPGLIVASALLVDYVMTVAVSVASGVDNIISAVPQLNEIRVEMAIFFVILLAAVNLRGVRESGKAFAVPTYLFIASVFVMIVTALVKTLFGAAPVAASAQYEVQGEQVAHAAFILLLLRAFASGCSALTGVEAIANGVPAFRLPKVKNAQKTLVLMGSIAIVLFAGLVSVALISKVHYAENACDLVGLRNCATTPQPSLISQVAAAVFGGTSPFFYLIQAVTAAVLLLAANTAFNGFPLLGSILARDTYAPKALNSRGDRLIYSNGVIVLAIIASVILLVFRANVTQLIQLYIIGVFVSFTLGQSGMVRHWIGLLKDPATTGRGQIKRSLTINLIGAILTFTVLVVVTITKFTHGAWIVFVVMPILFTLMMGVNRYYRDVDVEVAVDETTTFGASGDHAIVLVGKMQKPVLKAIDYAIAARHDSLEAVHVSVDPDATRALQQRWDDMNIDVPLIVIPSPYRDIAVPVIKYIKAHREEFGAEVVTVYTPIYIVGHWWESILHNHRSRRIRQKLMLAHGVTVALVPWLLDSSELLYGRRSRVFPGQDRSGEPRREARPVPRTQHKTAADAKAAQDAAEAQAKAAVILAERPGPAPTGPKDGKAAKAASRKARRSAAAARSTARNSASAPPKKGQDGPR